MTAHLLAVLYASTRLAEEGRVEELQQLLASGVVQSLKVVDSDGHHVLNIAIQHKQDKVVQVREGQEGAGKPGF